MKADKFQRSDEATVLDSPVGTDGELQSQLEGAFDTVRLPEEVRARALAAIEQMRESKSTAAVSAPRSASRPKSRVWRFAYGMAACLILVLAGFFGVSYVTEPTAYIDIDINPSIELAVNRFDCVVDVEALNDDAQEIIDKADVAGKPSTEAVGELMKAIVAAGYSPEDSFLELSISSDDGDQAISLESGLDAVMVDCGYSGRCKVVDRSVRMAAQGSNMGMGKYLAAQELMALDPDMTIEECSHMTMKQIRDQIAACEGHPDERPGQANGANRGENASPGNGGCGVGNGNGYGADGNEHGHHGMGHSQ